MPSNFWWLAAVFGLTTAILLTPAWSEDLSEGIVASHRKAHSDISLTSNELKEAWGVVLRPKKPILSKRDTNYRDIPRCKQSGVRRTRLGVLSQAAEIFDVVYYHRDDPAPRTNRLSAVRYNPALEERDAKLFYWQNFARVAEIHCLPTRFHMIQEDGQSFIEYREGDSAWR